MGYYDEPKKPIIIRDDRPFQNHDKLIDEAARCGQRGERTNAGADEYGYLGVDDIDRIRRRTLGHKIK